MTKVLGIKTHGNCSNLTGLIGEIIKCPECKNTGYHKGTFDAEVEPRDVFLITCNYCGCKFRVKKG